LNAPCYAMFGAVTVRTDYFLYDADTLRGERAVSIQDCPDCSGKST
jgi:hypothetical protein